MRVTRMAASQLQKLNLRSAPPVANKAQPALRPQQPAAPRPGLTCAKVAVGGRVTRRCPTCAPSEGGPTSEDCRGRGSARVHMAGASARLADRHVRLRRGSSGQRTRPRRGQSAGAARRAAGVGRRVWAARALAPGPAAAAAGGRWRRRARASPPRPPQARWPARPPGRPRTGPAATAGAAAAVSPEAVSPEAVSPEAARPAPSPCRQPQAAPTTAGRQSPSRLGPRLPRWPAPPRTPSTRDVERTKRTPYAYYTLMYGIYMHNPYIARAEI
jgi:hypothetical protein